MGHPRLSNRGQENAVALIGILACTSQLIVSSGATGALIMEMEKSRKNLLVRCIYVVQISIA